MGRFFWAVLILLVALTLLGFVLAHLGIVVLLVLAVGFLGRYLHRHGV
jgi:hypothetical protein